MRWSVEVFVKLRGQYGISEHGGSEERERIDDLETRLADVLHAAGNDEFCGNETGPDACAWSFMTGDPIALLQRCSVVFTEAGWKLAAVWATVNLEGDSSMRSARVDFESLQAWADGCWPEIQRASKRRGRRSPQVGDCYAIPLGNGSYGHVQYLGKVSPLGDFIRVVDLVRPVPAGLVEVVSARPLFPPLGADVSSCKRRGKWKWIGRIEPQEQFVLPLMRGSTKADLARAPGVYDDWTLFNETEFQVVRTLTEDQRRLEYFAAWTPERIAARILTGVNPYDQFI